MRVKMKKQIITTVLALLACISQPAFSKDYFIYTHGIWWAGLTGDCHSAFPTEGESQKSFENFHRGMFGNVSNVEFKFFPWMSQAGLIGSRHYACDMMDTSVNSAAVKKDAFTLKTVFDKKHRNNVLRNGERLVS